MRGGSKAVAFAVLVGMMGMTAVGADASTVRNARETVKQPRPVVVQASARSAKPQSLKPQSPRRAAATTRTEMSHAGLSFPISCVPYVRAVTGMDITGNAHTWWNTAAGSYARGQRPERGAVLSFRSSGGMRLGHVAVVSRVVSSREILIDHANWEGPGIRKGTVMRGVSVVDVSDRNDWTQVRVQVGRSDEAYGRVYPTNGFIYNRGPNAVRMAAGEGFEEVAEAPAGPHAEHLDAALRNLNLDAVR